MAARKRKCDAEIFAWSALYRLGLTVVDRQHKKLVDLINTLARRLAEQADDESVLKVLDALTSYAAYHFKTEEELMREYGLDGTIAVAHEKSHALFIEEIAAARTAAQRNPIEVATRLLTFLSRWLIQHILGTDMQMAAQIIALQKGMSPSEARKQAAAKLPLANEILLRAIGELYECVSLRTQEFLAANRQLKAEIAMHRKAEKEAGSACAPLPAPGEASRGVPAYLKTLDDFTELMLSCTTAPECCQTLCQTAERLPLGTGGTLAVAFTADDVFEVVAAWGKDHGTAPSFGGHECWALKRGRPNEVLAGEHDLHCGHLSGRPASYLCLPLIVGGRARGLVTVFLAPDLGREERARIEAEGTILGNVALLALIGLRSAANPPAAPSGHS